MKPHKQGMWLALLLPALSLAAHPDCFDTAQHKLKNNVTKQCKVVDYADKFNRSRRPLPVKWQVVDDELGVVRVVFPLLYEAGGGFTVYLLVNETVATPESCSLPGAFDLDREDVHTRTTFQPSGCQQRATPNQPKGLEVEFKFVFSGCYRLKVAPKNSPTNMSASRFLRTGYVKEVLRSPNVTRNFYHNRNVAFVSFKYSWEGGLVPLVVSMRHGIRPEMGSQACQTSGTVYACCSLNLPDVGSQVCEPNSTLVRRPNCKYESDGLTCEFFDLVPGNYCFTAEVLGDVRCGFGKVWEVNKCLWNTPLEIEVPSVVPEEHVIPTPWSEGVWYLLGPLLALGVLLGLVTYGYRLHGKPSHEEADDQADEASTSLKTRHERKTPAAVVLLYAQDCEPVMALMSSFRRLLCGVVPECSVLDPLEEGAPLLEALAPLGPHEWLRTTLRRPDALVVLVETPCAALRPPPRYRRPLPQAALFPLALQTLGINQEAGSYRRLLVVRFSGLSDGHSPSLSHLTPYRRFTLPGHLANLVDVLGGSYPEDCDAAALLAALEEANSYRSSHPDYLRELFLP